MADTAKATPAPIEEPASLKGALEAAAGGAVEPGLEISLVVAGGAPSQRYRFAFRGSGAGDVECDLECQPSKRRGTSKPRAKPDQAQFADLVRAILASGLLEVPQQQPRFLPDTVVGRLEISDGSSRQRWYFAADPDQASVQELQTPPAVAKAADALYAAGGRLMGMRSVKP
jgi:hypothetical protein